MCSPQQGAGGLQLISPCDVKKIHQVTSWSPRQPEVRSGTGGWFSAVSGARLWPGRSLSATRIRVRRKVTQVSTTAKSPGSPQMLPGSGDRCLGKEGTYLLCRREFQPICRAQQEHRTEVPGCRACLGASTPGLANAGALWELHYHRGAVLGLCCEVPSELLGQVGLELLRLLSQGGIHGSAAGRGKENL